MEGWSWGWGAQIPKSLTLLTKLAFLHLFKQPNKHFLFSPCPLAKQNWRIYMRFTPLNKTFYEIRGKKGTINSWQFETVVTILLSVWSTEKSSIKGYLLGHINTASASYNKSHFRMPICLICFNGKLIIAILEHSHKIFYNPSTWILPLSVINAQLITN